VRSGLAEACLRILIEPSEEAGDVRANLVYIEAALRRVSRPRLLHGVGAVAWELLALAAKRHLSSAFAALRSAVSKPSVNRSYTRARNPRASAARSC
jgi:hypothetical protein